MESGGSRGTKQKKDKAKTVKPTNDSDTDSDMDLWDDFNLPVHPLPDTKPQAPSSSAKWTRIGESNVPPLKPHRSKKSKSTIELPTHKVNCVNLCLAYYKEKKGVDYELVRVVGLSAINTSDNWGTHINFFARVKATNYSPELFFAELSHAPVEVSHCCKLTPTPYNYGETRPPGVFIFHCPHIECLQCDSYLDILHNEDGDDSEDDAIYI